MASLLEYGNICLGGINWWDICYKLCCILANGCIYIRRVCTLSSVIENNIIGFLSCSITTNHSVCITVKQAPDKYDITSIICRYKGKGNAWF